MKSVGSIIAGIIIIALIIVGASCLVQVPAGYVAVQYKMNGGISDEVLTQGWHMHPISVHTTLYTVGIEQSYLTAGKQGDSKADESFSASTKEGKAIDIDLTFTYQFDPECVTKVFTQFKGQSGVEVRDVFIKPNIQSWTKEVIARYAVTDILGSERASVNIALTDYLANKFEPYGIKVSNATLIDVRVDADTMTAINAKITAQQAAETQAINNQTNIDKAEADAAAQVAAAQAQVAKAQAEADALLIKTQAEADALRIESEAQAEANRNVASSITDKLLDKMYYDTWNGVLPQYMLDGNSSVIVGGIG